MLSLLENITGQLFSEYISAHISIADSFSLTKNGWSNAENSPQHSAVLNALAPYHIKTIYVNRWFCHCVPDQYKMEVYLFHFTPESKEILLSHYDSIFYNGTVWSKPEDLCFFKNKKLIPDIPNKIETNKNNGEKLFPIITKQGEKHINENIYKHSL